jgi:hypothetical protein
MDDKGKRELTSHIREHLTYPVTKQGVVEACSNMAHVPEDTRRWAVETLPDRTYNSADEVLQALGL